MVLVDGVSMVLCDLSMEMGMGPFPLRDLAAWSACQPADLGALGREVLSCCAPSPPPGRSRPGSVANGLTGSCSLHQSMTEIQTTASSYSRSDSLYYVGPGSACRLLVETFYTTTSRSRSATVEGLGAWSYGASRRRRLP